MKLGQRKIIMGDSHSVFNVVFVQAFKVSSAAHTRLYQQGVHYCDQHRRVVECLQLSTLLGAVSD